MNGDNIIYWTFLVTSVMMNSQLWSQTHCLLSWGCTNFCTRLYIQSYKECKSSLEVDLNRQSFYRGNIRDPKQHPCSRGEFNTDPWLAETFLLPGVHFPEGESPERRREFCNPDVWAGASRLWSSRINQVVSASSSSFFFLFFFFNLWAIFIDTVYRPIYTHFLQMILQAAFV